ncbi:MAG: hypothetical protein ACPGFC_11250, partial [Paracoccaceae bacterium]
MTDWTEVSAADLGAAFAAGSADPRAVTEAYLAKIDAHPMRDRIYARVTPDRARAEAAAARERVAAGEARDAAPVHRATAAAARAA